MNRIIDINKGWRPLGYQQSLLRDWSKARILALICSRQVGKSTLGVQFVTDFIFRYSKFKNPHFLVSMKTSEQISQVYLKRLNEMFAGLPPSQYTVQGKSSNGHVTITIKRPWLKDRVTIELTGAGNLASLKGRTIHGMVIDELAFFNDPTCWTEIFLPMMDTTNGKALITSTVNGRNHFYDTCMGFKDLEKQGYSVNIFRAFDVHTCLARNKDWIAFKEAEYKALGQYHIFRQEYKLDWDAVVAEEAPFMGLVGEKKREGFTATTACAEGQFQSRRETINVSMDMGKPENNPIFTWIKTEGVHIIDYTKKVINQYDLIDELVRKWSGHPINIIYPFDVTHPSINEGRTRLELIQEYVRNSGYDRIITLQVLSKTKNKAELLRDGLNCFRTATFRLNEESVDEGLDILSGVRLKKDKKTGYVSFGEFIKNGNQHTADAFCYVAAAVHNRFAANTQINTDIIHISSINTYKGFGQGKDR